jgi:membrane protein implicated in regulation of membrane protease activity
VPGWLIWAVVALALVVGEIFTPGLFFLGPVALAAIVAGVVALVGGGPVLQLIVFIGGSIASVAMVRPIAKSHLRVPSALRTGTAALTGAKALVLQRVDSDGGLVKIGGEEWTARAFMEGQVFEPGARVEVVKIEGATALVYQ